MEFDSITSPIVFNLSKLSTTSDLDLCIDKCVTILNQQKVIALPTDTIYGVGCIPSSSYAVEKIYSIKGRDHNKPMALCVSDFDQIYRWSNCPLTHNELSLFFPGKCTLIFERSSQLYNHLNPNIQSIGFRIPNDDFIVRLCSQLPDKSLVLTSANISNNISSIIPQEFSNLNMYIDVIVDKGYPLSNDGCRLGSTILDLTNYGYFKIIRHGSDCDHYKNILLNILKYKEI